MPKKINKVSTWITVVSILVICGIAVVDLFIAEENVPIIVYGLLGGIALGADANTIPALLGIRRRDE